MNKFYKNEKFWYVIAGAAAVVVGKKILKSDTTRNLAVSGLAKGMKLQSDAKAAFKTFRMRHLIFAMTQRRKLVLPITNRRSC